MSFIRRSACPRNSVSFRSSNSVRKAESWKRSSKGSSATCSLISLKLTRIFLILFCAKCNSIIDLIFSMLWRVRILFNVFRCKSCPGCPPCSRPSRQASLVQLFVNQTIPQIFYAVGISINSSSLEKQCPLPRWRRSFCATAEPTNPSPACCARNCRSKERSHPCRAARWQKSSSHL